MPEQRLQRCRDAYVQIGTTTYPYLGQPQPSGSPEWLLKVRHSSDNAAHMLLGVAYRITQAQLAADRKVISGGTNADATD
jgi:hypothetical protein